jgi:hypothetical protein
MRAGGRELGIIRWRERVYAIRTGARTGARLFAPEPSDHGRVAPALASIDADHPHPLVSCPWHGWSYDQESGGSVHRPLEFRVRSYPT